MDNFIPNAVDTASNMFNQIKQGISNVGSDIGQGFSNLQQSAIQNIGDPIRQDVGNTFNSQSLGAIGQAAMGFVPGLTSSYQKTTQGLQSGNLYNPADIGNIVENIGSELPGYAKGAPAFFLDPFMSAHKAIAPNQVPDKISLGNFFNPLQTYQSQSQQMQQQGVSPLVSSALSYGQAPLAALGAGHLLRFGEVKITPDAASNMKELIPTIKQNVSNWIADIRGTFDQSNLQEGKINFGADINGQPPVANAGLYDTGKLQPLAVEARKYGSADEFVTRSAFGQPSYIMSAQSGLFDKLASKYGQMMQDLAKTGKLTPEKTVELGKQMDIEKKQLLTDFYNQATGGVRQARSVKSAVISASPSSYSLKGFADATGLKGQELNNAWKDFSQFAKTTDDPKAAFEAWNRTTKIYGKQTTTPRSQLLSEQQSPSSGSNLHPSQSIVSQFPRTDEGFNNFLKTSVPEIKDIKGNILTLKDGSKGTLTVDTGGGNILLRDISLEKKGSGLGTKIVNAIRDYADAHTTSLEVEKPYNPNFWKKFGITEDNNVFPSRVAQQSLLYDTGKPLPPYSLKRSRIDTVWHETSPESAHNIVFAGMDKLGLNVATSPELALGQRGKGVKIELDASQLSGRKIVKPASEFVTQTSGKHPEYQLFDSPHVLTPSVKSVTFDEPLTPKGERQFFGLRDNWKATKEVLPDGKVKYTNPEYGQSRVPQPTTGGVNGQLPNAENVPEQLPLSPQTGAVGENPPQSSLPQQDMQQMPSQTSISQDANTTQGLSPQTRQILENAPVVERQSGGDNILNNLKPNYKSSTSDIQNLVRQYTGKFAFEGDQAVRQSESLIKYWEQQPKVDRLSFMQAMQEGAGQDTSARGQLADQYKAKFDDTYDLATQIKPNLPYKSDYFTKSGIWANSDEANKFYNDFVQQKLAATPGSLKQAVFPTIADGVKAGLSLKETNPETIYLNNYLQVKKAVIMNDFMETAQARGYNMAQVQKIIDRYMDPGFGGSSIYRNVRQVNNVLNSMDLGLSGFHIAGTTINASVSKLSMGINQLITGHPIQAAGSFLRTPTAALEYVFRGDKAIKAANKGEITPDIQNMIDAGGRVQKQAYYQGSGFEGAIRNTIDDINNGRYLSGIVKAPLRTVGAAINTMAKPIMEYWVPRIKNGALADLIENNIKNLPAGATPEEIQAVKAAASDSIDNRFGQLVQDNLFWNKSLKDSLGLVMRSPGWNIGTARELGLGTRDLFDVNRLLSGKGFSDRAAYTLALPIMTAVLGATYMYARSGQTPQSATDLFYPKTGETDPNTGKDERVSFPTYMKDVFAFFKNPMQTALNKASPLASDIIKQVQGVDYFGKPLSDPNADLGTQFRQRAASEVMSHIPFSLQSGTRRLNPTIGSTLESIMGINKAPASVTGGYYDKKSEVMSTLKPNEKQIMDYITLSSQNGGPSAKDKASVMIKNDWAIDKMKQIQLAANPKDLLWSKPKADIKAYFAYQTETDPKIRAQLLIQNPWIPSFQQQYSQQISQGVQQAKQNQAKQQQGLTAQIGNTLGVYNPAPATPSVDYTQRPPTPQSQLTPAQVQTAAAYTALPQGSPQRQALLAQNPWLRDYWNANQQYYQQNPTQATGALADYLRSVGIDPNVMSASNTKNFRSSTSSAGSRLSIRGAGGKTKLKSITKSLKFKALPAPKLQARGKVSSRTSGAAPKFRAITSVKVPKPVQAKVQPFKAPPIQKVNMKRAGRYFLPRYAKYQYI